LWNLLYGHVIKKEEAHYKQEKNNLQGMRNIELLGTTTLQ
jgi:hypothetical protein